MANLFMNAVTSFSSYPLRLVFFIGVTLSGVAGLLGMSMLIRKLLHPEMVLLGYASLVVSVWFLGGVIILILGVLGIYLSKVFIEVKDRPQYIIRQVHGAHLK
jgi:putative glycosyltransferase